METQLDRIERMVGELLYNRKPQEEAQPKKLMVGPGEVVIKGARFMLDAPIAYDWEPSMEAREFTIRSNSFVGDPSNGKTFNLSLRSAQGYPLLYTTDGFGGVRKVSVVYDGSVFDNDEQVEDYKQRVAKQKEAIELRESREGRRGQGMFYPPEVTDNDLGYLRANNAEYKLTTGRELFFDVFNASQEEIAKLIARGDLVNPGSNMWMSDTPKLRQEVERLFVYHRL